MNVKKTMIVCGGAGVILLLLALRMGGFAKESNPAPVPAPAVRQKPAPAAPAAPAVRQKPAPALPPVPARPAQAPDPAAQEEKALGVGDPFVYARTGTGDYTPAAGNKHVGIISVKGIIRMTGEEPKAILHLKDSDRVHYVAKNSVVRVSTGAGKGQSPAEAYIVVKDIRNDEVELIQLERPDKVIIVR